MTNGSAGESVTDCSTIARILKSDLEGVVGDCFCPSTNCEIYENNNVPQCVDASGPRASSG